MPPEPSEQYLTADELARRWRTSLRTLRLWRRRRLGPTYMATSGRVLYRLRDVIEYEDQKTTKIVENIEEPKPGVRAKKKESRHGEP